MELGLNEFVETFLFELDKGGERFAKFTFASRHFYIFLKEKECWIICEEKKIGEDIRKDIKNQNFEILFCRDKIELYSQEEKKYYLVTGHIVKCLDISQETVKIFLTVFYSLIMISSSFISFSDLLWQFVNLFTVSLSGKKTFRNKQTECGWFGELLALENLSKYSPWFKKKFGISPIDAYHKDEKSKYDFSFNNNFKLEVKTTNKSYRIHLISHSQAFNPYQKIIFASVLLQEDEKGKSLWEYFLQIKYLFSSHSQFYEEIKSKLEELGINKENQGLRIDYEKSIDNIKYYQKIPYFNLQEPKGVSETQYLSNFDLEDGEKVVIKFF